MMDEQTRADTRYWCWRWTRNENAAGQLQEAIQEYIKLYQQRPLAALIPVGLKLVSPMSGLDVQEDESVPPFRFYFALPYAESETEEVQHE